LHFDLVSSEAEAETERLLGVVRVRDMEQNGDRWTTFADLEGNELDLVAI
jgi:hypothetical protein